MEPKYITAQELDALAQKLGTIGAAIQWAKANGYQIGPTGDSFELPPLPGQQPVYDQPAGGLSVAEAPEQETSDTEAPSGALSSAGDLEGELLSYPTRQGEDRRKAFEQGQQYIAQAYGGPSVSQQLFALSKALLQPKPYRGFAGTMANVSSALGDIAKEQQTAQQKRALAEMELKSAYAKETGDDYYNALKLRYLVNKAKSDAAAKANAPVRGVAVGDRLVNPYTGEDIAPPIGTIRKFQGKRYSFIGGDQYDKNNWQEVR